MAYLSQNKLPTVKVSVSADTCGHRYRLIGESTNTSAHRYRYRYIGAPLMINATNHLHLQYRYITFSSFMVSVRRGA